MVWVETSVVVVAATVAKKVAGAAGADRARGLTRVVMRAAENEFLWVKKRGKRRRVGMSECGIWWSCWATS